MVPVDFDLYRMLVHGLNGRADQLQLMSAKRCSKIISFEPLFLRKSLICIRSSRLMNDPEWQPGNPWSTVPFAQCLTVRQVDPTLQLWLHALKSMRRDLCSAGIRYDRTPVVKSCGYHRSEMVQHVQRTAAWLGAQDCTPEIDTSEIIVDLRDMFLWIFSDICQWIVTSQLDFQRNYPVDCHWDFPMDVRLCEFWCAISPSPKGGSEKGDLTKKYWKVTV